MRLPLLLLLQTTVTIFHFSDYHSHALPFYTEEGERGGIARGIGFLEEQKRRGAVVFSGGDTINKGAPAWSDEFQCAEWSWWNGVVDAMAFGNHDADYGFAELQRCRETTRYPILSANTSGFAPSRVFVRNGIRIGVFAVAGDDFPSLVKVPELQFSDPVEAARKAVAELKKRADVIVMIGHQHAEDDYELARSVPGIDLIFGSHSHLERELTRIPGTNTMFISPGQYLTYISWVELQFAGGKLGAIDGALLPVDERMPEDRTIAKRVASMQQQLERAHPDLFAPIGKLAAPLSVEALAQRALSIMRDAAKTEVAISTTSSFRSPLGAGTLTMEALRAAMPYDNEIVVCTMTPEQLQRYAAESFVSGELREAGRVATTDYLAGREKLQCDNTGVRVRAALRDTF